MIIIAMMGAASEAAPRVSETKVSIGELDVEGTSESIG